MKAYEHLCREHRIPLEYSSVLIAWAESFGGLVELAYALRLASLSEIVMSVPFGTLAAPPIQSPWS